MHLECAMVVALLVVFVYCFHCYMVCSKHEGYVASVGSFTDRRKELNSGGLSANSDSRFGIPARVSLGMSQSGQ